MALTIDTDHPLPTCDGPKLHRFESDGPYTFHFKRALDQQPLWARADTEYGPRSHVFLVTIDSQPYVLKIFKFFTWPPGFEMLDQWDIKRAGGVQIIQQHADPFFTECRAYGRLIEAGLNGKVAAACYGYIMLPPILDKILRSKFGSIDWNWDWSDKEYDKPIEERLPFRAILKEYVPKVEGPMPVKTAKRISQNLRLMRENGLYVRDVAARNYHGDKLVDFDVSITEPHFLFQIRTEHEVKMYKYEEFGEFNSMIEDAGIKTWLWYQPDSKVIAALRPRKHRPNYQDTRIRVKKVDRESAEPEHQK